MVKNKIRYEYLDVDWGMKLGDVGGVAVDAKDNLYVALRGVETPIIIFDKDTNHIGQIGTGMGVKNAHGIGTDPQGNVLLVDTVRQVVHKFAPDGKLLFTLGTLDAPNRESGAINGDFRTVKRPGGPFYNPAKVATTGTGEILVADGYGNCCIHRFTKDGKHIKSWGKPGSGPGEFYIVHGIGVDQQNNDVYIADRENDRIQIFDIDGNVKAIWTRVYKPTDCFIRGDYVYVSELGKALFNELGSSFYDPRYSREISQVRVFDKKGNQVAQIGTEDGGEPGSFLGAHGICVDSSGSVYVSEVSNWERHNAYAAWPNGKGMPTRFHPCVSKFKQV